MTRYFADTIPTPPEYASPWPVPPVDPAHWHTLGTTRPWMRPYLTMAGKLRAGESLHVGRPVIAEGNIITPGTLADGRPAYRVDSWQGPKAWTYLVIKDGTGMFRTTAPIPK